MLCEYTTNYKTKQAVIHYWYRNPADPEKRIHVIDSKFEPYFYVKKAFWSEHLFKGDTRVKRNEQTQIKGLFGEELVKVVTFLPKDVGALREVVGRENCCEADIKFPVRFMIDKNPPELNYEPRVLYLDIEVFSDEHNAFELPETAGRQIISMVVYDNFKNKFVSFFLGKEKTMVEKEFDNPIRQQKERITKFFFTEEKELLEAFILVFKKADVDIIVAWNAWKYDAFYLINRIRKVLGEDAAKSLSPLGWVSTPSPDAKFFDPPRIQGRMIFDALVFYQKVHSSGLRGMSLDAVSKELFGIGKDPVPHNNYHRFYLDEPEKFLEYNIMDVLLMKEIENKTKLLSGNFVLLSQFIGCPLLDTLNENPMLDVWFLRFAKKKGIALPCKPSGGGDMARPKGAVVIEPKPGIYENVMILDLKRLYPSIILSCNISPESARTEKKEGEKVIDLKNGIYFVQEPRGFVPEVFEDLTKFRAIKEAEMKKYPKNSPAWVIFDRQKMMSKNLINAVYGVLLYSEGEGRACRLYSYYIGESIPYMGRHMHGFICLKAEQFMRGKGFEFKLLGGDTDAIHIGCPIGQDAIALGTELRDFINHSMPEFCATYDIIDSHFAIEFEKVYRRLIYVGKLGTDSGAKKKYGGMLLWYDGEFVPEERAFDGRGFQFRRSDSSEFSKNLQIEVIKMICKGGTKDDVYRYVHSKEKELDSIIGNRMLYHLIGVPKQIKQKEYAGNVVQQRAAQYSNRNLGTNFTVNTKPMYLFVQKVPKGFENTNVIAFEQSEQIPDGFEADKEVAYESNIRKKLESIFVCVGWRWDEFQFGQQLLGKWGEEK